MRDKLTAKILRLFSEMEAAFKHGPDEALGKGIGRTATKRVHMYDATSLARSMQPEASLHYSTRSTNGVRTHCLEYIVLHDTGESLKVTLQSIRDWLDHDSEHIGGLKVEEAFKVIDEAISDVEPGQRRVLLKALGQLSKSLRRR
jgi:hypothetical protein